jgi:hypothetical protein
MLRALVVLLLLVLVGPAAAEPNAITFGSERYVQAFGDSKPGGQLLVEFVRPGETVARWRKLVTIHRFPAAADTASVDALLGN